MIVLMMKIKIPCTQLPPNRVRFISAWADQENCNNAYFTSISSSWSTSSGITTF